MIHRVSFSFLAAGLTAAFLVVTPRSADARWGNCPEAARKLVDRADRATRGNSSKGVMKMQVFKRGTVSMRMKFWSVGRDKFLAKIKRPSRLRGSATMKSGTNLWSYSPRLDRIMKVGSSMMGGSWMGSHFTNDDLVKETDLRRHYTCQAYKKSGRYIVTTLKPKPNAPVVWGKMVAKVDPAGPHMIWVKYYDERGRLKRTMSMDRVRKIGGRTIPTRFTVQPADKPSERTVVTYLRIRFNVSIPSRYFTLQGLKR